MEKIGFLVDVIAEDSITRNKHAHFQYWFINIVNDGPFLSAISFSYISVLMWRQIL